MNMQIFFLDLCKPMAPIGQKKNQWIGLHKYI